MKRNKEQLNTLCRIFNLSLSNMYKYLKDNDINSYTFYELVVSENILQRRAEFYTYFNTERVADNMWHKLMDWYLER